MQLPIPPGLAQQHSLKLQQHIRSLLQAHQGLLSLHDYMQQALYAPGLGYYSAGASKFGIDGDFITAPELSPFFGQTLAKTLLPVAEQLPTHQWLEFGAGTGKLAASILDYLISQNKLPEKYYILEISADLRQRQQDFLAAHLPSEIFAHVHWLDALPEQFTGIVIGNEVLDAFPVHRFTVTENDFLEQFVCWDDGFQWYLAPSSSETLTQKINEILKQYRLSPDYISEVNLQQAAFMQSIATMLQQGVIALVDYGYSQREYYAPERCHGTLRCQYRHFAHDNPFWWPGLQDITAHVDFTALALQAMKGGLSLLNFSTQSNWLLHAGILELAQQAAQKQSISTAEEYQWQNAIRRLVSPQEMGELFKIMILGTKHFNNLDWPMRNESMRLG